MIKLLQRTETEKLALRYLWQQADIGREFDWSRPFPHEPLANESCYYCRYKQTFANSAAFNVCQQKHSCYGAKYPIIDMSYVLSNIEEVNFENPDGTYGSYQRTGIYKQVKFEAQPHHVQLRRAPCAHIRETAPLLRVSVLRSAPHCVDTLYLSALVRLVHP